MRRGLLFPASRGGRGREQSRGGVPIASKPLCARQSEVDLSPKELSQGRIFGQHHPESAVSIAAAIGDAEDPVLAMSLAEGMISNQQPTSNHPTTNHQPTSNQPATKQ